MKAARGATAVAAYDPFRSFLPEPYTSPGGTVKIRWDSEGRKLKKSRQERKVPQLAATDGGNTTFFAADSVADADDQPNFFGTSAAHPTRPGSPRSSCSRPRGGAGRSARPRCATGSRTPRSPTTATRSSPTARPRA